MSEVDKIRIWFESLSREDQIEFEDVTAEAIKALLEG